MSTPPTREEIEEICQRAKDVDAAICKVASQGMMGFRMSIPPQSHDTDMLIVKLAREDVPLLIATAESALWHEVGPETNPEVDEYYEIGYRATGGVRIALFKEGTWQGDYGSGPLPDVWRPIPALPAPPAEAVSHDT